MTVRPDEHFDGAQFRSSALDAIQQIVAREKRVLVVGGTGLYLRALTRGLFAGPPADPPLRLRLQEQEQVEGKGFLHRRLKEVDPTAANRLHPHDTVRLVRALEVFLLTNTPISQWQQEHGFVRVHLPLTIGLVMEREMLLIALNCAVAKWCKMDCGGGAALGYGIRTRPTAMQTIGYSQMGPYYKGAGVWQTLSHKWRWKPNV
jgi:tRNA dimethylallyltransferase